MNGHAVLWNELVNRPDAGRVLHSVMWHVANGLSKVVGRTMTNGDSVMETVPLSQLSEYAGGPEAEMVGVYMLIRGPLRGQAILIMPLDSALKLSAATLGESDPPTSRLGQLEHSVLAEVGNMTLSFFLNAMAARMRNAELFRPYPPAVMVDMLGAILDVITTPMAVVTDELLVIETPIADLKRDIHARFWVLPEPAFKPAMQVVA
jgi:chemotaxis protein CheC